MSEVSEKLRNGLELTVTLQLALEIMDSYPVKFMVKKKLKEFLEVAEQDIGKEWARVFETSQEFAINALKKKHDMIKIIATFNEADAILCGEFLKKFNDNLPLARKNGLVFFNKII